MSKINIAVFVGSLRRDSFNARLATAVAKLFICPGGIVGVQCGLLALWPGERSHKAGALNASFVLVRRQWPAPERTELDCKRRAARALSCARPTISQR